TTFLRHVKSVCNKNLAVVAPTGVAAINAGGTTIHSFFQLPFGPFNYNETASFFAKLKINNERRQVFRQLELLIIDEISMVRSDLLDAIDVVLRHFRFRHNDPFGGVQVLMIGDMYQLSPVVKEDEWSLISANYRSHYFFDSRVMQQAPPVHLAFDKIYRQQDERFVRLLNQIRHNSLDAENMGLLESLYQPHYKRSDGDEHIILTTHNAKADAINSEELKRLRSKAHSFKAKIDGEFSDRNFPTDEELVLKEGARVMFIKNDTEKVRRYFNGKIGEVTRISDDAIFVLCKGDEEEIEVKKETWKNIRYTVNHSSQQMDEDELGSFTQYPLRLAWAVTIHKSQGLTFDNVIIDAGAAFAPGQVYVALSRCTNLEGIVLLSAVPRHRLANDSRVVQFAETEAAGDKLEELLHQARHHYQQKVLLEVFDFAPLINDTQAFIESILKSAESFNESLFSQLDSLVQLMESAQTVAVKFATFMKAKFNTGAYPEEIEELQTKIRGAVAHFNKDLAAIRDFFSAIKAETDSKMLAKEFNEGLKNLYLQVALKAHFIAAFADGFALSRYYSAKRSFAAPHFSVNAYAGVAGSDNNASPHPVLHQQLRQLRNELCDKHNLPVYMVASGKTLDELALYLPQTKPDLQKISGFGKVNVDKWGPQFLETIQAYCAENHLDTQIATKVAKRTRKVKEESAIATPAKEPTHRVTLALFREGKTASEIAKQRGLAVSTIESHLAASVSAGDIDPFIFISAEKIKAILKEEQVIKEEGMTAAKIKLGDDVSYFDIKLAVQYQKRIAEK
ncbi:MAG: family ATPase, partial [Flaviaesturariibacter sp.]|nr:family ATPase [Flaviaesturariibacter sp.]